MVNVAICGNIEIEGTSVPELLSRSAHSLDIPEPAVCTFASTFELLEHLDDANATPFIDFVFLRGGQRGMSALQVIRDARSAGYTGGLMLVEDTSSNAPEAWRLHVDRYVLVPLSPKNFTGEIETILKQLARIDNESTILRIRGNAQRIMFSQLVYAQTFNHDQALHMSDGQIASIRCSSQDLFDKLSHDSRFLKLGSSYIVNLDFVRAMRENGASVLFTDGSTASVPVRFRKTAQKALLEHAQRKKPDAQEGSV